MIILSSTDTESTMFVHLERDLKRIASNSKYIWHAYCVNYKVKIELKRLYCLSGLKLENVNFCVSKYMTRVRTNNSRLEVRTI